jgi:ketosteroid isomerase-like protein
MKVIFAAAILLVCTSSVFSQETRRLSLTTNILEQTYATLEKAVNEKDLDTVLAHLATNVVITVSLSINSEIQKTVLSKNAYAVYLMDAWARTGPVSYKRLTTVYDIAGDAQSAIATTTFRQTTALKDTGETFRSTGKEVSMLKLISGVPMSVKVDATVSFE